MIQRNLFAFFMFVGISLITACDKQEEKTTVQVENPPVPEMSLEALIGEFTTGYYRFNPDAAVDNGLHEYDGKLPDFSTTGVSALITWVERMQGRLNDIDRNILDSKQTLYAQQLEVVLDSIRYIIEDMKVFERHPYYAYSAIDPDLYLAREYAPLPVRFSAYMQHVEALPAALTDIKTNLRPMPSTYARLWRMFASGLAEYISTVPAQVFADINDPVEKERMNAVNNRAAAALINMAEWVGELPVIEDFALGEERFARMLWAFERIDTPLAELKAVAQSDLDRNLNALKLACEDFLPGADASKCISKLSSNKPPEGPVQAATRQLTMLRKIVLDRGIVTIPSEEMAVVAEAPPHRRSNSAYISRPGPYEKGVPAIYYIAPPDPTWSEADQYQYIPGEKDLLQTSIHEVWPGHFLEGLHTNRSGNPVSEIASSYTFTEGWAHYTEEMMTDLGLENDPETRIGQLVNALLRDVRFLSSLGLHTGGMTVAESEQLFLEKAYLDPGNARQQAARGTFDPGYLFYTVGKLMIMKLRDDWLAANPGRSLRDFHDTFLSFGAAPVALIRKQMLGDHDDGQLLAARDR